MIRKGQKVVFVSTILSPSLRDMMHLTYDKVYTVTTDFIEGNNNYLHLIDDAHQDVDFLLIHINLKDYQSLEERN